MKEYKFIREKDGKLITVTEFAYQEMKKSGHPGLRPYIEMEEATPIKIEPKKSKTKE